jgi:LysM repeat protein
MFGILLFTLVSHMPADSLRTETINGKVFVVHQVEEKETLYSISRRYGATILAILEQNPTADAGIEVGQILKVPYAPKAKTSTPVQTAEGFLHRVEAKETLFSLARQYNVSVDDIKTWNSLKDNSLTLGQTILIRKKPPAQPAVSPNPVQTTTAKTHTVAPKETLFSIARQYGVTWQQLQEWNSIKDAELKIGQVISVSGPAATSVITPAATSASTQPTTAPIVTQPATSTITVSEGVTGTDELRETGMAELIEGSEGNRKYLAQHRTIKPGTILKIRNVTTNQEVFVRVTSPIAGGDPTTMIRISKSAYDRLGATEPRFRAEITYYK